MKVNNSINSYDRFKNKMGPTSTPRLEISTPGAMTRSRFRTMMACTPGASSIAGSETETATEQEVRHSTSEAFMSGVEQLSELSTTIPASASSHCSLQPDDSSVEPERYIFIYFCVVNVARCVDYIEC